MQPGRSQEGGDENLISTPRGELAKLRQQQAQGDAAARAVIMDALLDACGEFGYRRVTVETVCRRYGGSRGHFYRHFPSKADCFVAAYSRESERLEKGLAPFADEPLSNARLREALDQLAAFASAHPLRARALLVEVHVAGGDALRRRNEVFERLSLALDKAGRETVSRHSAPPITGEFMINVVDQALSTALIEDSAEEFARTIPELTSLICEAYGSE